MVSKIIVLARFAMYVLSVFTLTGLSATVLGQGSTSVSESLVAVIFQNQPEGCRVLSLGATRVTVRSPDRSEFVFITMALYGDANGVDCASGPSLQALAFGSSDQAEIFTVDQRLREAALRSSIPMIFEGSGAVVPFSLDLNWTGIEGQLSPERFHQVSPGSTSGTVIHVSGYGRPATPSGAFSDGSTNYAANPFQADGQISVQTHHSAGPKPRLLH